MPSTLTKQQLLNALKAAGDDTRLRLLVLLAETEHNVKDLTEILNQSQPRLSRHLKLLTEAGLIERFQEGSWVYYRRARKGPATCFASQLINSVKLTDKQFIDDQHAAQKVIAKRAFEAQDYFQIHAKDWDSIRTLYVREEKVETAMQTMLGKQPIDMLLDLGTGTGRILELFANQFKTGIGIDINHEMLRHARARLDRLNLKHCELRHGDLTNVKLKDASADTIIMHQILHFFAEPREACKEAARLLKSGGKLMIVDFAPHTQEQLRQDFAHQRLGFDENQIWAWLKTAGLKANKFNLLENTKLATATNRNNDLSVSIWLAGK